jgi:hypothetical protein
MIPHTDRTSAFDLLIFLVQARQWDFDHRSNEEFYLPVRSQRFGHFYQMRAHRNHDPDSLSFDLSRGVVFPPKSYEILKKTARRLNSIGGSSTFSVNINNELRLICPSHLGRKKPEYKADVIEKRLDDAMLRMDCGWDAVQMVLHANKDPVEAVQIARLEAYGSR